MTRGLWDWGYGDSLAQFRSAVDRLFENFGVSENSWRIGWESVLFPPLSLAEDEGRFIVEAQLPGVRMKDLEITCLERNLTLRGERKSSGDPEESYDRRERPTGSFVRTLELPSEVDAEKITASLEDGLLTITVPKAEKARPRRIEVKAPAAESRKAGPAQMGKEE